MSVVLHSLGHMFQREPPSDDAEEDSFPVEKRNVRSQIKLAHKIIWMDKFEMVSVKKK